MRWTRPWKLTVVWLGLIGGLTGTVAPPLAAEDEGSGLGAMSDTVTLAVDAHAGGAMTGVVRNTGDRTVRDVRLLIRHSWLWKDERNPGPPAENPGRSAYYVVDGEVPPNGELRFRYSPNPPLPSRTDGSFVTTASVVSFVEVGEPE